MYNVKFSDALFMCSLQLRGELFEDRADSPQVITGILLPFFTSKHESWAALQRALPSLSLMKGFELHADSLSDCFYSKK